VQSLRTVRKASQELRNSDKLSKILEVCFSVNCCRSSHVTITIIRPIIILKEVINYNDAITVIGLNVIDSIRTSN